MGIEHFWAFNKENCSYDIQHKHTCVPTSSPLPRSHLPPFVHFLVLYFVFPTFLLHNALNNNRVESQANFVCHKPSTSTSRSMGNLIETLMWRVDCDQTCYLAFVEDFPQVIIFPPIVIFFFFGWLVSSRLISDHPSPQNPSDSSEFGRLSQHLQTENSMYEAWFSMRW